MRYVSTRTSAHRHSRTFKEVLVDGMPPDGGLYVPASWPHVRGRQIKAMRAMSYAELASAVMRPFVDGISKAALQEMAAKAYSSDAWNEGDSNPVPLAELGTDDFAVLELFRGPTRAFKDVAMRMLAQMLASTTKDAKNKDADASRTTIVAATSGDTGAAAVAAFKDVPGIDLFVLYPDGRVTAEHLRQMRAGSSSTHAVPVAGTFDDCQRIVKTLFADLPFAAETGLAGVNSVNWARVLPQIAYYFHAYCRMLDAGRIEPGEPVNFAVPTGNFGDAYAGYAARQMGLPVGRIVVAVNDNDSLHRAFATGVYEKRDVVATTSVAMDIQVASNFERLLFDASSCNHEAVAAMMDEFRNGDSMRIPYVTRRRLADVFMSGTAGNSDVARAIRNDADYGLIDPHTAVAVHVARQLGLPSRNTVVLATAHPDKSAEIMADIRGDSGAGIPMPGCDDNAVPASVASVKQVIGRARG